jgi:hypothetical protein
MEPIFIYLGIFLIALIFLILSWIFEFFKKKKISEFFERVAEAIRDFFT